MKELIQNLLRHATATKLHQLHQFSKKETYREEKNYRPITSIISVDEIFEQLLCNQITGHYDPTLYHRMTAYKEKYSCEVTLLTLVEEWKQAVDRKELGSIVSSNMSKAFDSLCPALSIKKLEAYGFCNCSLDLTRSFFNKIFNRVKINGHTSEWKNNDTWLSPWYCIWTASVEYVSK